MSLHPDEMIERGTEALVQAQLGASLKDLPVEDAETYRQHVWTVLQAIGSLEQVGWWHIDTFIPDQDAKVLRDDPRLEPVYRLRHE